MTPIWQTTFYTTTADTLTYNLLSNPIGEPLFSGRAYKMPGETNLNVNISEIAAPYLGAREIPSTVWNMPSGNTNIDAVGRFYLTDNIGTILKWCEFVDDWSYEALNPDNDLSEVINGHFAPNMICFNSFAEYDEDEGFYNGVLAWGPGGEISGYTTNACGRAALYYKTRRGGFASFLIEGYVKRYDDFSWSRYKRFRSTSDPYARGETTYLNEIQPRWELNTAWLNNEQSKNLAANLLSSPCVYLHLLDTNEIFSVTITDNNVEYKEFRRDRKLIQYKIAVSASNKRIRR